MPTCIDQAAAENWTLYHGDCCEVVKALPDNSVHISVHSPPFSSLYIYSDSERDMGNCASDEEFIEHYRFLIRRLFRVMIPGRVVAVHCKDLPKYANKHGAAGLIDFPGMIIQAYEAEGFVYHSRVTIWKCPVTERERTNNNGLLHKTATRDRSQLRQGMADFIIAFRKPGVDGLMSSEPVTIGDGTTGFNEYCGDLDPRETIAHPSPFARKAKDGMRESVRIWQRYAEPVWWDINQTRVLNYKLGRDENDEKHICPLQLDVIHRCLQLWSNPGDVVLSPFAGIGSEGYEAILMGRKFVGIELKESYYRQAIKNLQKAEQETKQASLFQHSSEHDAAEMEAEISSFVGDKRVDGVTIDEYADL